MAAVRLLFAANSLTWLVIAALVLTGTVSIGAGDPATTILALLMVGNAALLGLAAWRVLRGQRIVDLAAVALVAVNALLTVTDEVGGYDLAILFLNVALLIALLAGMRRTVRWARQPAEDRCASGFGDRGMEEGVTDGRTRLDSGSALRR